MSVGRSIRQNKLLSLYLYPFLAQGRIIGLWALFSSNDIKVINRSINHSLIKNRFSGTLIKQPREVGSVWIEPRIQNWTIDESVNQSINHSVNQSNQSIYQSITLIVGDDFHASVLINADARIRRAQIDADHRSVFVVVVGSGLRVRKTAPSQKNGQDGVAEDQGGDGRHRRR